MRIRTQIASATLVVASLLFAATASAQPHAGPIVAGGAHGQLVDAYGNPAVVPVQYCEGGCAPGGYYGGAGYDQAADVFGGAGLNCEQVGPHYFDISADYVFWRRDTVSSQINPISVLGLFPSVDAAFAANEADPTRGVLLDSADANPGFEPGFRIFGRYDVGALSVFEVGYTGVLNQNLRATAIDPSPTGIVGELFSPLSGFGTDDGGAPGGIDPSGDLNILDIFDQATSHTVEFESDLHTAEINLRRYWVGASPRVSGTILAGFRYTRLNEQLTLSAVGPDFAPMAAAPDPPLGQGTGILGVRTDNDLAGFQIGGDATIGIRQGVRLLTEGKVGIFNNNFDAEPIFSTSDGLTVAGTVFDEADFPGDSQVAFIGEARVSLILDVLPSLSVKAGYDVLFLNSVALAADNFNNILLISESPTAPPFVNGIIDQGDAVFHGFHAGIEYIW